MATMNEVRVTFKSGATVAFDTDSVKVTSDALGGRRLTWGKGGKRSLVDMNLDEVVAIVFDHSITSRERNDR